MLHTKWRDHIQIVCHSYYEPTLLRNKLMHGCEWKWSDFQLCDDDWTVQNVYIKMVIWGIWGEVTKEKS